MMAVGLRRLARPGRALNVPLAHPIIAAGAGVGCLGLPHAYPIWDPVPLLVLALVLAAGFLLLTAGRLRTGPLSIVPWVLAGYLYGHWFLGEALASRLPLCSDSVPRVFSLEILDRPLLENVGGGAADLARFRAEVQPDPAADCPLAPEYHVRLTWYDPPALARGDRWRAEGRLRPPWGNRNPGGFDYERWLLGQSLAGTGYVRSGTRIAVSGESDLGSRIRSTLTDWVQARNTENAGVVLALMTGDDSLLDQSQWRLLRDSGTVHLLVVSGVHVGMVGGFLFAGGSLLARTSTGVLLGTGARRFAAVFALLGSSVYVWISGAGVPALRAWLMSAMVLTALMSGRSVRALEVVGLVMALLLLSSPLIVHQQGFWLSFAAVLALVAFFGPRRRTGTGRDSRLIRLVGTLQTFLAAQAVILLALSPLLSAFQGEIPLQSPVINALVVPLVTFAVLPVLLLSALLLPFGLLAPLADQGLAMTDALLSLVMGMIGTAADVPAVSMSLDGVVEWLPILAVLLCWQRRVRCRIAVAGLALWWALLLPDGQAPRLPGEFQVTALDVGQGSAIFVDTRRHRLVFDAGPKYASGFDLGDSVVVPSFQQYRQQTLSALVLSHDDLDHTGGAGAVVRQLRPERIWASFSPADAGSFPSSRRCTKLTSWQWDGVRFEFLHPEPGWHGNDNDRSCVLLISNGNRSALLAGDISRQVEARLPKRPVDLLMAPHHGSRTSSSPGFVRGFAPALVFVSTDRRSRYGHPHPDVVARYADAELRVTGIEGALRWSSSDPERAIGWRQAHGAYWHWWPVRKTEVRCPACE